LLRLASRLQLTAERMQRHGTARRCCPDRRASVRPGSRHDWEGTRLDSATL
jgi:hypothetical protein